MRRWILLPLTAAFLFFGFTPKSIDKPKLVVFISIDQAMPGLLKKYDHLFTGGYRWLIDHGVQFENAYHNHGYTTTGPGHYVLTSGRHPGNGGVITNQWFDRELRRGWYCVEDTSSVELIDGSTGRSYQYIDNTTLGDWLKSAHGDAKVVSIAGKDRSAVLLGGKSPEIALWYDKKGGWTSSSYYTKQLPDWVKVMNNQINATSYLDSTWEKLAPESVYQSNASRQDSTYGEADWTMKNGYNPIMPVVFKDMGIQSLLSSFNVMPQGDRAVLNYGQRSIDEYNLGADEDTDILFLGLSATDGVGHSFGPHSHEQLDNYLRLDKNLGQFIQHLETKIGEGNVLYVVSSDHGAIELPEFLVSRGIDGGRIPKPTRDELYRQAMTEIGNKIGPNKVYRYGNFFYFDKSMGFFERRKATKILKKTLINIPGIASVSTREELLKGGDTDVAIRLKNMVHPEKSPNVYLIPKKYWTWRYPTGSSHGSPYEYDAHIPLIFAKGGAKGRTVSKTVYSVDIAPTVAKLLGVPYPDDLDGKPIPIKN